MSLKNYTSQQPASTSIRKIEQALVDRGCHQIMKEYDPDTKHCIGLSFIMEMGTTQVPVKLPARLDNCERELRKRTTRLTRPETLKKIPAQSERTAWKILQDWVEAQMAMVDLAQVEIQEVMFPYIYDAKSNKSLYERAKELPMGISGLLS